MALPTISMEDINQRLIDRYREGTYQRGERPNIVLIDDPDIVTSTTAEEAGRQIAQSIRDSYSQGYGGPEPAPIIRTESDITIPTTGSYTATNTDRVERTAAGVSHLMGMADTHLGQMNRSAADLARQELINSARTGSNNPPINPYTLQPQPFNNMPIGDYPNSNIQEDRFSDRFFNGLVSGKDRRILKYGTSVKVFDKEIEERIEVRVVHSFSVFDVMYYVVCPVSVIQGAGSGSPEPDDMFVVKVIKN